MTTETPFSRPHACDTESRVSLACWLSQPRRTVAVVSLLAVASMGSPVSGQTLTPSTLLQRPLPGTPVPGQPQVQMPLQAPITLTPSIGIAEEYNDNVFMNNDRRRWDLITVITPGLAFTAERPTWRFNVAYEFDARLYARDPDRNNAFDRQTFTMDSFYRVDPALTLSLEDSFAYTTGLNAFAPDGIVTGRDQAWANTLRPGATWQLDRLTSIRAFGAWTTQGFEREDLFESDTYRADIELGRNFTPRLRGTVGYQFAYFDIEQLPSVTTHTPRVGLAYDFTPTLNGSISGGPTFEMRDGDDTRVTPMIAAALRKRYAWGETGITYNREVGLSSGLGGTADNQTIGASVAVMSLMKGLTLLVAPQYRTSVSDDNTIDVRTFTFPIQATYQITAWFALNAGYSFLHQRSDSTAVSRTTGEPLGRDVDQNRVFVGLVFGYPIKFD